MQICYLCLQATHEGQASHAHVHEIIRGLQSYGCEVSLFEPHYANGDTKPSGWKRLLELASTQRRIRCSGVTYDVIYIRSHFAALPTSVWARLHRIPTVLEINGPIDDLFIAWPWTRRFRHMFNWVRLVQMKWSEAVITVTPQLRSWVIDATGRRNVYVIPNGANSELFVPKVAGQAPVEQPYVVFFGAMAVWQGIDTMLDAINEPQWPQDVDLVLIGDGVEKDKVERAAYANPRVKYVGKVPYRDVPSFVANALAGLSLQNNAGRRSETGLYPLKVFETMSCGIPVIATDWPGQSDLIRSNNCGIVIPPSNPSELARAVALLHSNPSMAACFGANGRKAVEREHSWEARAHQTYEVIASVMRQNRH